MQAMPPIIEMSFDFLIHFRQWFLEYWIRNRGKPFLLGAACLELELLSVFFGNVRTRKLGAYKEKI